MFEPTALCQSAAQSITATSRLDVVKTAAAAVALPGALFTFWLGFRQKEKERNLAYYHKVVTDFAVPVIFDFFAEQVPVMFSAGNDAQQSMNSQQRAIPKSVAVKLASFSTGLFSLQNSITDRTIVFDERITKSISDTFEMIQDDTSNWFNDISMYKRRNAEEITVLLRRGQRTVIGLLYKGQFRNR